MDFVSSFNEEFRFVFYDLYITIVNYNYARITNCLRNLHGIFSPVFQANHRSVLNVRRRNEALLVLQ